MQAHRYQAELELATRLALEAGARIREEFHREGGPRSSGPSHAEVDAEVEASIREGLRTAFPEDGYVGEESGRHGPARAARTWYVDPHDGTSAFLEGHRGSAVSIGLVVDGAPVLGVVYAPTAPDDGGDLTTWSEGGTLCRNGAPVERPPLPGALGGDTVVAFNATSSRGEKLSRALAMAEPGRVVARASIAWRLALVAVGEADAAVSLSGPTDYDVAAGHALLRAVGGVLLDAAGNPVRYGERGSGPGNVFGGHPAVASALAARASKRPAFRLPGDGLSERYPHAQVNHRHKVRDAGRLARAQGALLGQVAGDALGAQVEFCSRTQVFQRFPGGVREMGPGGPFQTLPGQPTDDSEMALMLARTVLARGGFSLEEAQQAYRDWLGSGPFDVGTTTRLGLEGGDTSGSEANGSLMRISPLAVHLWRNDPEAAGSIAVQDASITHESAVCIEATAIYASAIALAVREGLPPRALYDRVAAWVRSDPVFETPVKALFSGDDVEPVKDFHTHAGWALVALRNAFHQLLHAPSFEEAVVRTVSQGGDADTNGAIVGALLGAVYGRDAVPLRWRRTVLSCRAVTGRQVRPAPFWADDLMELAEQLVATGPLHEWERTPAEPGAEQVVTLEQVRKQRAAEAEVRAELRAEATAALEALEQLRLLANGLALFSGFPMPADSRVDANGVSAPLRGLANAPDPVAAAVGQALVLLTRVAAGTTGKEGGGRS
ncbi:MAG: hypothetical protein RL653_529 [Pseudomonadota bacterium]|jgi:ADP-ribosylglycohydrolase/fructose-1,6-bisphosphatase/inositol monophosphatase family enzyme